MEGRLFTQYFFLLVLILFCLVVTLAIALVYDFKCDTQIKIEKNLALIEFLNRRYNFCFNSEIEIGDGSLLCKHPKNPYRIDCDKQVCYFNFLNESNTT